MNQNRKPRNIIMWLRSNDDHNISNFQNRKAVAYHKFFQKISEQNNFRFAFDFESYLGKGVFSNVAIYKNGLITKTKDSFTADVIYQYNKLAPIDFSTPPVITNTPKFRNFCSPKINAYEYMPQFFPPTFSVFNKEDMLNAVAKIKTAKVVFKPNKGSNGDDVFIFDTDKIDLSVVSEEKLHDQGFLVQEFIDTGAGIPGIVFSYHDLRIITHGDKISLCHVRQPVSGSLVGNSHKGASIMEIDINSIPKFILDFYAEVQKEITKVYPKPLYSMDIGVGKDGPKLIELNSHTAFPGDNFRCMDRFIDNIVEHLETI